VQGGGITCTISGDRTQFRGQNRDFGVDLGRLLYILYSAGQMYKTMSLCPESPHFSPDLRPETHGYSLSPVYTVAYDT
jgi:hypothetical protein